MDKANRTPIDINILTPLMSGLKINAVKPENEEKPESVQLNLLNWKDWYIALTLKAEKDEQGKPYLSAWLSK